MKSKKLIYKELIDKYSEFLSRDNTDKWRGSIIYGEFYPDEITVEEVSEFGNFFKEIFISYFIPFENGVSEEYKNFRTKI